MPERQGDLPAASTGAPQIVAKLLFCFTESREGGGIDEEIHIGAVPVLPPCSQSSAPAEAQFALAAEVVSEVDPDGLQYLGWTGGQVKLGHAQFSRSPRAAAPRAGAGRPAVGRGPAGRSGCLRLSRADSSGPALPACGEAAPSSTDSVLPSGPQGHLPPRPRSQCRDLVRHGLIAAGFAPDSRRVEFSRRFAARFRPGRPESGQSGARAQRCVGTGRSSIRAGEVARPSSSDRAPDSSGWGLALLHAGERNRIGRRDPWTCPASTDFGGS